MKNAWCNGYFSFDRLIQVCIAMKRKKNRVTWGNLGVGGREVGLGSTRVLAIPSNVRRGEKPSCLRFLLGCRPA